MSEPRTEAGEALLADWDDRMVTLSAVKARILAIETEAGDHSGCVRRDLLATLLDAVASDPMRRCLSASASRRPCDEVEPNIDCGWCRVCKARHSAAAALSQPPQADPAAPRPAEPEDRDGFDWIADVQRRFGLSEDASTADVWQAHERAVEEAEADGYARRISEEAGS